MKQRLAGWYLVTEIHVKRNNAVLSYMAFPKRKVQLVTLADSTLLFSVQHFIHVRIFPYLYKASSIYISTAQTNRARPIWAVRVNIWEAGLEPHQR